MSEFGEDLVRSLKEALDHAKGKGPAFVHTQKVPPAQAVDGAQGDANSTADKAH